MFNNFKKIIVILLISNFIYVQNVYAINYCCKGHGATEGCEKGELICTDGAISKRCDCNGHLLEGESKTTKSNKNHNSNNLKDTNNKKDKN